MTRSSTALATDAAAQTYADGNPLGTPGEHKHHTKAPAKLTFPAVAAALPLAVRKLAPRQMVHSPVMFTVLVGAGLCTVITLLKPEVFSIAVTAWLWLTVLFGTLSESIAEGRGKAQADSLRASRKGVMAKLRQRDGTTREVPGTELKLNDVVICEAGDIIPSDGEIIEGLASVDESTITGESAPVIRESGGDRSSVTGCTRVLSDRIVIRITAEPGETFIDRMIKLVEGAVRQKTPNEIALHVLLVSLTIVFLAVTMSLAPFASLAGASPSPIVLVALLVCLIPTTIGALVPAIGIAGMDRLVQHNVLATSGRAVETAGDITTLLLDKTGTITYGNRRAVNFFPANHVERAELIEAARVCSLADDTPEGRSIVELAADKGPSGPDLAALERSSADFAVVAFSATTRMSGLDLDGRQIRKGAAAAVTAYVAGYGGHIPAEVDNRVREISAQGGTPLLVARVGNDGNSDIMGTIHLADVVKPGMHARFAQLRKMGIRTVMITGDNPITAKAIAAEAGVDDFVAEATPEDKLAVIRNEQAEGRLVAMTGDGTNDAPALAAADVGVAMNSGTPAA
jgi:K+-transporting ATPase ATPase B chain